MHLYDGFAKLMLEQLNAASTTTPGNTGGIGASGAIDFYTTTDVFTSTQTVTGMLNVASRVLMNSTPIGTFSTSGDPTGTRCTAVFNAMTTGTAAVTATAAYFAILNTNAGTATVGNLVLTGSVGTSLMDINFNVVNWDTGDNISITSLTFVQPK
jgi:hypothetical protein